MADEIQIYGLDAGANEHLTMTKEQIIAAIMQAVSTGVIKDVDAGFITKIQEMNENKSIKLWIGTMAQFNALENKDENTLYIFSDDPTISEIGAKFDEIDETINNILDGTTAVPKSINAENAENAAYAENAAKATNATKVNLLEIKRNSAGVLKINDIIIPQKEVLWEGSISGSGTVTLQDDLEVGDIIEIYTEPRATSGGAVLKGHFRSEYTDTTGGNVNYSICSFPLVKDITGGSRGGSARFNIDTPDKIIFNTTFETIYKVIRVIE